MTEGMDPSAAAPAARLAQVRPVASRAAGAVERSTLRDLAHGVMLALAWVLILVLWVRVLRGTGSEVLLLAGGAVLGCAVVSITVTRLWIAHNVGIHRRKGPRTGVPVAPLVYGADWVGRGVTADWDAVRRAAVVVVCASAARKVFLPDPSADAIDAYVDGDSADVRPAARP